MAKTSSFRYLGDLRIETTHTKSGQTFITDAPEDNNGKGSAFSPTDLMATSLGLCMLTIMGIAAPVHGFTLDGVHGEVTKIMASNPRRISEIIVDLYFPDNGYTEKQKQVIRQISKSCPVALSLNSELKQEVNIIFE
ncbi:MAG: OsmC family protein [Omnitrophica WOR_2 bacterium]